MYHAVRARLCRPSLDGLLTQAGTFTLTRDPTNGMLIGTTLDKVTTQLQHTGFGEVSNFAASASGVPIFTVKYARDDLGRITEKTETLGGVTDVYDYAYDVAGRLSEVKQNSASVASFTYDLNGNRLTSSDATGTFTAAYDAQDRLVHRQSSASSESYAYTTSGELLAKTANGQTTQYQYDVAGNLMSVALPNGTQIEYLVDGRNRRIGKKINGALVQGFLYGSQLQILAELDSTNHVVSRFVYAGGGNVPSYMFQGATTYRIITDHLGSPRLVVNTATGAIVQRMDYDAWGNVINDTNPGFQPFGFAGGLYDRLTFLTRFGARDYDAAAGRWTTKDPVGFAGGTQSLYAYSLSIPNSLVDVSGSSPEQEPNLRSEFGDLPPATVEAGLSGLSGMAEQIIRLQILPFSNALRRGRQAE